MKDEGTKQTQQHQQQQNKKNNNIEKENKKMQHSGFSLIVRFVHIFVLMMEESV